MTTENERVPISSVVICTRNRGASAVDAVRSVLSSREDLELLVIDQSTNDETESALAPFKNDPRYRYVRSSEVGTGRARNMGLRLARGKFVLYTDDDCEVAPNWVATMTSVLESHARVAFVTCNVEAAPHDASAGFVPAYHRDDDLLVKTLLQKCTARGIGAGMAVRRDVALEIGGFDARLGPGTEFPGCEEGDMAVRTLLRGYWLYETAQTHVVHDGFRTWQEGKALTKRNWTGIGAAYVKPLRCGHLEAGVLVAYEGIGIALLHPASRLLKLQKPQGLRGFVYFWRGFWAGMKTPLDREHVRYVDTNVAP
jgi:glycosyltransferase involved in cell wall biosynthesis